MMPISDVIRVLVVDDSAYVRKVVTQMLKRSSNIDVVGTARDGYEALEQVAELHPDVRTPVDERENVRKLERDPETGVYRPK